MEKKKEFPYRDCDNDALFKAANVASARYQRDIESMANEILDEAADSYDNYEDAYEFIYEQIHEAADGCSMVIYTGQSIDVLKLSDNWLAAENAGVDLPTDISKLVSVLAYYAVSADILEMCDTNESHYFFDDEEEEEEEEEDR